MLKWTCQCEPSVTVMKLFRCLQNKMQIPHKAEYKLHEKLTHQSLFLQKDFPILGEKGDKDTWSNLMSSLLRCFALEKTPLASQWRRRKRQQGFHFCGGDLEVFRQFNPDHRQSWCLEHT